MKNLFTSYIQSISSKFSYEETSEMGYRTDFEILIKGIFESINVKRIDHDAKAKQGNKPDFVVLNHDIPILYIEAKDIGVSLDKVEKSEQMARYYGYANLILTDYVEFRFYRNGIRYEDPIKVASYDIKSRTISPIPESYEHAAKTLLDFTESHKEPIQSGKHLSKIMGGKARRIRDNVRHFFATESEKNAEIVSVYETIKKLLVHDLTPDAFADMYAQTLVYGLFVARYHDDTPDTFSRQEARDLVPISNPFLGHFFDHIAGRNFEKRLGYIVDELCEVFTHANVKELMSQYFKDDLWGKNHEGPDPVIHFYEDFLKEYDPDLRKKMGAYYTPLPVVRFIVRAVDALLVRDFGLVRGLADTTKNPNGIHRIQVLDPAVGTGTFISAVIRIIYERILKEDQKGTWPSYVHHDLLPRIHAFELMMAPYTIAHLKLSIAFEKTGFKYFNQRLGIYLTNSLEESGNQPQLLAFDLGASIAEEAKEAAKIKNEKPIMVVIGNPPYSVSSSNKGQWIMNLLKDYKKDLNERKLNLDDDYIKFVRFAEHFIEKNGTGIVAMITNSSFIDGITHRQMRKHLLETFDNIYILDLHGSATRKEKTPDGGKDENVFDIQQGVSISIFVRTSKSKKKLGKVHHAEIFGLRSEKYEKLNANSVETIKWQRLDYKEPYYFFVPRNFEEGSNYNDGFKVNDIFRVFGPGVKTERDKISIHFKPVEVEAIVNDFKDLSIQELRSKYDIPKDSRDWSIERAKNDVIKNYNFEKYLLPINYRPFDQRFIYYTGTSKGFVGTPGKKVMQNIIRDNIGLILTRQFGGKKHFICFISNRLIEISSQPYAPYTLFPLYLHHEDGTKSLNLNDEVLGKIKSNVQGEVRPENILDYIYAVLYSPSYREKYKEFLKIDFPRVPYPKDTKRFKKLAALGSELRSLHLLESPKVNQFITTYPVSGSAVVDKLTYKDEKVFINTEQYFGNVPESAWNFYIGGYQPAQKWLKDRKGRMLSNQDLEHYQKIIVVLVETDRIMKEIDKINF